MDYLVHYLCLTLSKHSFATKNTCNKCFFPIHLISVDIGWFYDNFKLVMFVFELQWLSDWCLTYDCEKLFSDTFCSNCLESAVLDRHIGHTTSNMHCRVRVILYRILSLLCLIITSLWKRFYTRQWSWPDFVWSLTSPTPRDFVRSHASSFTSPFFFILSFTCFFQDCFGRPLLLLLRTSNFKVFTITFSCSLLKTWPYYRNPHTTCFSHPIQRLRVLRLIPKIS